MEAGIVQQLRKRLCELEASIVQINQLLTVLESSDAQEKPTAVEEKMLNSEQAMQVLNVSRNIFYKLLAAKEIPYFKIGRNMRFKKSDLEPLCHRKPRNSKGDIDQQVEHYLASNQRKS